MHLRWFFPSVCAGCGRDVPEAGPICSACASSLRAPPAAPRPPAIDRFHAVADFESPLRDVILSFKYRGRAYLGDELAAWMVRRAPAWAAEASAVLAVPAPWARRVFKGYHPAEVLAGAVARRWEIPFEKGALRRRHGFPSQTHLDRGGRRRNALRSFAAGWRMERIAGRRVLIVDDVCTTGATLTACAALLRAGGAVGVDALVLAQEALGRAPFLDDRLPYRYNSASF